MIVTHIKLSQLFLVSRYSFAAKKNSHWIYSSESQQMVHGKPGLITLAAIPHNHKDTTLRLHKAILNSHLVLSPNINAASHYLKRLQKGFIEMENTEEGSLTVVGQSLEEHKQTRPESFSSQLEMSKQLEAAIQNQKIVRSNNDRDNRLLKAKQDQLIKYMEVNKLREQLEAFRGKNGGFPQVGESSEELAHLQEWKKAGINILFLLQEDKLYNSKSIFQYLRQHQLPYEVLPTPNNLINTLAASGFPADRFTIEYFPPSYTFLAGRTAMKMTLAIAVKASQLKECLKQIALTYGASHLIYLQDSKGKMVSRGQVWNILDGMEEVNGDMYRVAVAPYLSTFNESLKEEKDRVSQIKGQMLHELTHFVKLEFLNKELVELTRKKGSKEVILYSLFQQLLSKGVPLSTVNKIVKDLRPCKNQKIEKLGEQVAKEMPQDYIGLSELNHKQQRANRT